MAGVLRFSLSGMVLSGVGLTDINNFVSVIEVG